MKKILFVLTILLGIMIIFCPIFLLSHAETIKQDGKIYHNGQCIMEKDGHIYIVNCFDYEKLKKDKMQAIYDEINALLDKKVSQYRRERGFIDNLDRERRERELQQIQNSMARLLLPKISSGVTDNTQSIIPIPIPIPIPTPIPPDNGNGNGLGGGQGNGGNNNGNNGGDNGFGTGNGNNGNGGGVNNGNGSGGVDNGNNNGNNGNGNNGGKNK